MSNETPERIPPLIRLYQPDDAEQIARCIEELQDYERELEPNRVPGQAIASRYLAELLTACAEKKGAIFVAVADVEVIAGFVCIWLEHEADMYLTTLVDYAYISDLIVRAPYRGRGIGQALLARAEAHARQVHAHTLRLNVLAANATAQRSYHYAGFRDYELSLLKRLD